MGVIDTPDSQSLLAQFPTSPFSRTLTRLQVDAASIFLRFINWVAPGLPVPEIDLQDFFSSTEATKFIASCGSRVKHLTLRFSDLGWANPEGIFIFYGGLSHNSSLITLDLGCEHASIIPILHQLPSPHLSMSVVTLHMTPDTLLRFDSNLGALEDLFTSHFPAARLEIIGTHDDVEPLLGLRDGLFARMRRLREEGRLGFKRSDGLSMDPDTPSVMDSLLEDQGTVH
ncbi:hypothetical protein EVJ58_g1137 [Rhodofomes roseus]|nr:hypothetical protein EVJ58_g1137 [Rhodofomes roseus]